MRTVTVAATQMACSDDHAGNLDRAEALVRDAAAKGAQIVLLQELFETPYFCKDQNLEYFGLARSAVDNPTIERFAALAADLRVVLPLSFFEAANNVFYNSLVMIDADGTVLDTYRKTHIPQAPGYEEKYYFCPGDTGFRVWDTAYARIGAGICWDQWFPETARSCALMGAELMVYPTAIGSEPQNAGLDSAAHWQRAMQGHSASNILPVVASNRIGAETGETCAMTFYGSSFITDCTGAKVAEADRETETVLTASFDLDEIARFRGGWGMLRDRRPEMYGALLTLDGREHAGLRR